MPKLNLDKNFVNKLNNINRSKSKSDLKSDLNDKPKKSKFKISQDNSPFMPTNIPKIKKQPEENKENPEFKSITSQIKKNSIELKRLMLENITDTEMMWDSFDDNIKKIILGEIIEKYYLYKVWKINSISFLYGFIVSLLVIFLVLLLKSTC